MALKWLASAPDDACASRSYLALGTKKQAFSVQGCVALYLLHQSESWTRVCAIFSMTVHDDTAFQDCLTERLGPAARLLSCVFFILLHGLLLLTRQLLEALFASTSAMPTQSSFK